MDRRGEKDSWRRLTYYSLLHTQIWEGRNSFLENREGGVEEGWLRGGGGLDEARGENML